MLHVHFAHFIRLEIHRIDIYLSVIRSPYVPQGISHTKSLYRQKTCWVNSFQWDLVIGPILEFQQMSNAVPTLPHYVNHIVLCSALHPLRDSSHHSTSSVAPSSSRIMSSMFGGTYSPSVYGGTFNAITKTTTYQTTRPSGKLMII